MISRFFACPGPQVLASWLVCWLAAEPRLCAVSPEERALAAETNYHWIIFPITVGGLPAGSQGVPLSASVDLAEIVSKGRLEGLPDERSLALYRVTAEGLREEVPVQFTAERNSREKERRLLPGTSPQVSYLSELPAGQGASSLHVRGSLTWRADAPTGSAEYTLRVGVPRTGRVVQVPYEPYNLRAFDASGAALPARWFARMQIRPQWPLDGTLDLFDGDRLLTTLHLGPSDSAPDRRSGKFVRPFLFPVNGPDHVSLTEFGKSHDPTGSHAHHYSLWVAHADVDGLDFWSERGGAIRHEQFANLEVGPVCARAEERNRWVFGGTNLLLETRQWTFYAQHEDYRLMDLELAYQCAEPRAVTFRKSSFGLLAARVAQSMSPFDGAGEIRNSVGARNEAAVHLQRAAWLDQSGPVGPNLWNGIAIFDHPKNRHYPTVWHCRNDGWAGASFSYLEPFTLKPEATLRLRYRILLHRHDAVRGNVAQRFAEYAAEPQITIGEPKR